MPTLLALIESNKSGSQTLGKPSLLLVIQHNSSMKAALGEMHIVQSVNTQVKMLISARATPPAMLKCLQDHWFVHIICHGILKPGKLFDSLFKLYSGQLAYIVRHHLILATQCGICVPCCLSHSRADGWEPLGQGTASDCSDAVLWIQECHWNNMGDGRQGWATHGPELLFFFFFFF